MTTQGPIPEMALAYKRYKEDTETVAGWLAGKAAIAGYKPNASNAPLSNQPKLKGRARKLARDAAKQSQGAKTSKYKYIVTTAEFIEMAKHIVKFRPKIILSQAIQAIWERTIRTRRSFQQWFQSKTRADIIIDEQHSHFASILEEALAMLKPCYEPSKTKPVKKEEIKETPLKHLNTMFQHLEVEDILSDEEQNHAGVLQSANKPEAPRAKIEFVDKEAESEFFFAIWSFMQDAHALRVYVCSTWQLYCVEYIELMQAAQVTNLAVDMIRRAEADFEGTLNRPHNYPASKFPTGTLPFLLFKMHIPSMTSIGPIDWDLQTPFAAIICGCEICDFLLYVPWFTARSYVHMLELEPPTFGSPENDFRVQVPSFPNVSIAGAEFHHARNPSQIAMDALKEILPNFSLLSLMLRGAFVEDEVLHAARHLLEVKAVPIWTSFALQLQVDIERLGKVKSVAAFRDLKQAYELIKERADKHFKWHESLKCELWEKSWHDHVRRLIGEFQEWIEGKKCGKSNHQELLRNMDGGLNIQAAIRASGRVPLLEYFPVTCGTMKTELLLEWHTLGLKFVNHTFHVPMLCHLYNALRTLDPEAPTWPDMELLIRNQSLGKYFVGGRPRTLEDAQNRFLLSCGVSAASFAKDSRGLRYRQRGEGLRLFEQSPLSQILFKRWVNGETRKVDEASYELQQLLVSSKYQKQLETELYVNSSTLATTPFGTKLIPLQSKMVRILARLSRGFNAEMPALMFDYFAMQRRCYTAYGKLKSDFKDLLKEHDALDEDKEPILNNPISTTRAIFKLAVNTEAAVQAMTSKNRAASKAHGPAMAKILGSFLPQPEDEESRTYVEKAIRLTRQGRFDEVVGEFADISKNASAMNILEPVRSGIDSVLDQGKGDVEIRKLRKFVGTSSFGIFLFRQQSLQALYGPGDDQRWKDIGIEETVLEQAVICQADNPGNYLLAMFFLRQEKMNFGQGTDSHASSGLGTTDVDGVGEHIKKEWFGGKDFASEASIDKEDWEKWEDIYGKKGRLAYD